MKAVKDAKQEVLTRLLEVARYIRKRGVAEQAAAVLPYEQQLERDLATREQELAAVSHVEQSQPEAKAA